MEIGERVKHVESMKVHRSSSRYIKTADKINVKEWGGHNVESILNVS